VRAGDPIRARQLLARVDSRDTRAAVAQARATRAAAAAAHELASREARRSETLFAEQAVSAQAHERVLAARDQARAGLQAAGRLVAQAEAQHRYGDLLAPFDGVVVQRLVDAGDLTVPGAPLLTVERHDSVRVVARVPETEAGRIGAGDTVLVEVEAETVPGLVRSVVPDVAARLFEVQVWLAADRPALRPGRFARVRFTTGSRTALLVPRQALVRHGQLAGVFVVVDGRASLRWLRLGPLRGDDSEVLAGLEEGDVIAIASSDVGLRDGDRLAGG
jgi:RND family efflux transporter MFP subunit